MSNIRIKPWVGINYYKGLHGVKVLILGESHYPWQGAPSIDSWTIACISAQVSGSFTKAFWTKIATSLLGYKPNLRQKGDFWHSVMYYNFVQEPVGTGPRQPPNKQSWTNSISGFIEVVETYQPEFILILGDRLINNFPNIDQKHGPMVEAAKRSNTWYFNHSGGQSLAYGIIHPSGSFSPLGWHPHIMEAVRLAKLKQ